VLDDGVLTSGRGDRVYFSEALIIFTSNLGIYSLDATGSRIPNVTAEQPFEEISRRVRQEIENHFKLVLNRPEILNRIGENIIVFDFIRPEIAAKIFGHMVEGILSNVGETGNVVTITEDAKHQLRSICLADLSHGGRGIRNQLEAHLINPLARALFDQDSADGRYQIEALESGTTTTLKLVKA
jgi:ATP-dependent Clp protease ATP-binding subunit ClpA